MKREILFLSFIALFSLFLAACSSESTDTTEQPSDTLNIETPDTIDLVLNDSTGIDTVELNMPELDQVIAQQNEQLQKLYNNYKTALSLQASIETEKELKRIFEMRDSLISLIQYEVIENHFVTEDGTVKDEVTMDSIFSSLGIQLVYAEGMYAGLAEAPLLSDKINEVASDPFRYYLSFKQAYGNSLGSEYTYDNLEPEMNMIQIGELLRSEFPKSEYIELTKENYESAILALTDFHGVKSGEESIQSWIVGGAGSDMYPSGTSKGNFETFVSDYSDTKLSKVTEKILKNPSYIEMRNSNEEADTVYLIITGWESTWSKAREVILEKIQQGKDIPHSLEVNTDKGKEYAITFRFYPSLEVAEENLPYSPDSPSLIKVLRDKNGLTNLGEM